MRIGLLTEALAHAGPREVAFAAQTEAEATLLSCSTVTAIPVLRPDRVTSFRARRLVRRTLRPRGLASARIPALPWVDRQLAGTWDMLVAVLTTPFGLANLEALRGLRRRAGTVAVWIPEYWPSGLRSAHVEDEPFELADHVFTQTGDGAATLSAALGRPVHQLPLAVDVTTFAPPRPDEERPVAVINLGRRDRALHEALLEWSARTRRYYLYDTVTHPTTTNAVGHRRLLASHYQRSAVAVCNHAKFDEPDLIGNTHELAGRLFEGLAAGCRLIGRPPAPDAEQRVLGGPVVEPIATDVATAVDQLEAAVTVNNTALARKHIAIAMRGHDWAHRWLTLFATAGMEPPAEIGSRVAGLAERADRLDA